MDNFYVITNEQKDMDFRITKEITDYLIEKGKRVLLSKKDAAGHIVPGTVPEGVECALVLGGDGTLIRAARELEGYDKMCIRDRYQTGWRLKRKEEFRLPLRYCSLTMEDIASISWIRRDIRISRRIPTVPVSYTHLA